VRNSSVFLLLKSRRLFWPFLATLRNLLTNDDIPSRVVKFCFKQQEFFVSLWSWLKKQWIISNCPSESKAFHTGRSFATGRSDNGFGSLCQLFAQWLKVSCLRRLPARACWRYRLQDRRLARRSRCLRIRIRQLINSAETKFFKWSWVATNGESLFWLANNQPLNLRDGWHLTCQRQLQNFARRGRSNFFQKNFSAAKEWHPTVMFLCVMRRRFYSGLLLGVVVTICALRTSCGHSSTPGFF